MDVLSQEFHLRHLLLAVDYSAVFEVEALKELSDEIPSQ